MSPYVPSDEEVAGYMEGLSNWGRWGKEDVLGTLNLLTPEKRKRAAGLVRDGIAVSCARTISTQITPDMRKQPIHYMVESGERWGGAGAADTSEVQIAEDFIGFAYHGHIITHVDIPGHFFWKSRMYNGRPCHLVTTSRGVTVGDIETIKDGVFARGVLLDVPRSRGIDWLEPGEGAFPEDLEAAEKACGVRVKEGDVLLIRTGHAKRRSLHGPMNTYLIGAPGPHAACLPWLHKRGVAMLGSDTSNDIHPAFYKTLKVPVHQAGLVAMGLWLLDNCDLEALAQTCERLNRWEFLITIGALRVKGGTGSPVNPIAVF